MTIEQAVELARQWQRAGRFAEAESIFRQVVGHQPDRHEFTAFGADRLADGED